jgi:hypothetical protein
LAGASFIPNSLATSTGLIPSSNNRKHLSRNDFPLLLRFIGYFRGSLPRNILFSIIQVSFGSITWGYPKQSGVSFVKKPGQVVSKM